ncbi:unnamed protein product [Paramecium octaurelia]|uniref:Uncharacterized protein n=1 Tax=Paramecium octaurelia TaxID=43137 RepID=A0A8S1U9N9_PAROT|nr:unnamed protein product [Paramecium octaurelia]
MLKPILFPINAEVIDRGHYYELKDDVINQQQDKKQKQKLILKELLEFILNKQIQPSQREIIIKAYRRVLLENKKEQWLKLCNYSDSFLNQFKLDTKFMGSDDVTINQAFLKLNQIVKHFIPEYLEQQSKELTIDNEFIENNLKTVLSQLIEDLQNYQIYKSDVHHGLEAMKYYQQETYSATLSLIQSLNNYIKYVLLYDADCQQMSIENSEVMLNTFQQTFTQWYEKSKARLNDKLNILKKQAEQALMEKKKYELELEMLKEYENKLKEDQNLQDVINQNRELRNQIQEIKQQLKRQH